MSNRNRTLRSNSRNVGSNNIPIIPSERSSNNIPIVPPTPPNNNISSSNLVTPLLGIRFPPGFGPNTASSPATDCTVRTPVYSSITAPTISGQNANMNRSNSSLPRLSEEVSSDMPINGDGLTLRDYISASVGAAQASIMRGMQENMNALVPRMVRENLRSERNSSSANQNSSNRYNFTNPVALNQQNIEQHQNYQNQYAQQYQYLPLNRNHQQQSNWHQPQANWSQPHESFNHSQANTLNQPQANLNQNPLHFNQQQPNFDQQQYENRQQNNYNGYTQQPNFDQQQYENRQQNNYNGYTQQAQRFFDQPPPQNMAYSYWPKTPLQLEKWGLKYDGTHKSYTVEDFVFRVETLMEVQRRIMERRQQPSESADAYLTEITKLKNQMKNNFPERELVQIIKDNLKDGLAQLIFPIRIDSMEQLLEGCRRAERNMAKRTSYRAPFQQYRKVNEVQFYDDHS